MKAVARIVDRSGAGVTMQVSLGGRTLTVPYDGRDSGPWMLFEASRWDDGHGPITPPEVEAIVDALWRPGEGSGGLFQWRPKTGVWIARRWGLPDDGWVLRVVPTSYPEPGQPGHGVIDLCTLGRTARVPYTATMRPDPRARSSALLTWAAAQWIDSLAPITVDALQRARPAIERWLATVTEADYLLSSVQLDFAGP